jgi:hypothetical protein
VIEIHILPSGDRAEAETPESAVAAARLLMREARRGRMLTKRPIARYFVEGRMVAEIQEGESVG